MTGRPFSMGDEYEEADTEEEFEDEEFSEDREGENVLKKRQENVFCPKDGEYMPYHVKGALVLRRCPKCGFEEESG
ncbi:MAG: hypothetical protein ACREA0_06880 [bacterium]